VAGTPGEAGWPILGLPLAHEVAAVFPADPGRLLVADAVVEDGELLGEAPRGWRGRTETRAVRV
jgi:hypothetical protein